MNPNFDTNKSGEEKWLSMAEVAVGVPYSAEYLSLLARKGKLTAKKINNTWYTTQSILDDYMKKQMIRVQVQNGNFGVAPSLQKDEDPSIKQLRSLRGDTREYLKEYEDFLLANKIQKSTEPISIKRPSVTHSFLSFIPHTLSQLLVPLKNIFHRNTEIQSKSQISPVAQIANTTPEQKFAPITSEIENALERVLDRKFAGGRSPVSGQNKNGRIGSSLRTVFSSKTLIAATILCILILTIFPVPLVFSFFEKSVDFVKSSLMDSNTVLGFRPGTHANEILLLNKNGNISIMGHIETEGQFRSYVADGTAPIVVDSKTMVKNLNAEYLGGASSTEFTLAFITKNGAVTTDNVLLGGSVEVGKTLEVGQTLMVKGATKLLSSLEVDGNTHVIGDAEFNQMLKVLGPAYFEGLVTMQDNLSVNKNLSVRGSITAGRSIIAKNGSFGSLGVSGEFSVSGDTKMNTVVANKITSVLAFITSLVSNDISVQGLTATSSTITNATTTNLYSTNGSFATLCLDADTCRTTWPGGGGATSPWATTTSEVIGQFINYSLNNTDVVTVGGTSTTSAPFWFDPNTLSAKLQNFTFVNATGTNATTTNFFATTLFSTTASSTYLFSNNATIGDLITGSLSSGSATLSSLLVNGPTTLQDFTGLNSTTTNSTSTNFFATTGTFTNLFSNTLNLTNLLVTSSSTLQNFTFNNATGTSATTTNLFSNSGMFTNLFSNIANLTNLLATNATSTYATSTNLYTSGQTILAGTSGNVGIGTANPTNSLSFGNTQAQKIAIENSTNVSAGKTLTLAAGGTGNYGTSDFQNISALVFSGIAAAPNGDIYGISRGGNVYKQIGGSGSFVLTGQTLPYSDFYFMSVAPNGNVYVTSTWTGTDKDIYMQTNGTGSFVSLNQTHMDWFGITVAPNGNVYAAGVLGGVGDIYMQTNGTGNFEPLHQTSLPYRGMAAAPNGDIYVSVQGGTIYKQTGGTGDFVSLNQGVKEWWDMAAAPNGNIYVVVLPGDIYMQTGGTGNFTSLGQGDFNRWGITVAPNGDVYNSVVSGGGAGVYKQTAQTGTADLAGGNLILSSGVGKGIGTSNISFFTGTTLTTGTNLQTLFEKMTILGNGNVGIGTTNPNYKLEVNGTASTTNLFASYATTTNSTSTNLFATTGTFTNLFGSTLNLTNLLVTGSTTLQTFTGLDSTTTNATSSSLFSTTGTFTNLFGSTSNLINLLVTGSSTLQNFTFINATGTNATTSSFFVTNLTGINTNFSNLFATNTTSTYATSTNLYTSGQTILSGISGNVGIGTASPGVKLDVLGNARVSSIFTISNTTSCTGGQALQTNVSGDIACGTISVAGISSAGGWTTNDIGRVFLSTTTDQVVVGASSSPYAKFTVISSNTASTTLVLAPASAQTANILDIYNSSGVLSSVVTADGRFGIGTTNPGAKLDVNSFNGAYDQISAIFHAGENWTGAFNRIQMRSGTGDGVVKTEFTDAVGNSGAGADFRIRVADASDVLQDRFTIQANGNVGIGTISPNFRLEVNGTASTTNLFATNATTTNFFSTTASSTNLFATNSNLGVVTSGLINGQTISSSANFTGTLFVSGSTTIPNFTSVNSTTTNATSSTLYVSGTTTLAVVSGNVGIGTVNPLAKLDVNSYNGTYDQISAIFHAGENWTGAFNRIQMRSGTGDGVVKTEFTDAVGNSGAGADFRIRVADASDVLQDRFTILTNGNVGIGTISPNFRLEVNGTASTTNLFATNATTTNFFSTTASSTNLFATNSNLGVVTSGLINGQTISAFSNFTNTITTVNLLVTGSTTIQNLTGINSTTTNATSSTLYVSGQTILAATSGNVGIGTTAPVAKLETTLGASGLAPMLYSDNSWPQFPRTIQNVSASITTNDITSYTGPVIGLNLENSSQTNNTYSPLITFSRKSASGSYNTTYASIGGVATGNGANTDWTAGDLVFGTANSLGPIERMRILSGGNVGIGTSAPNAKLDVYGGAVGQTSSLISARGRANSFEWGHANGTGYLATLGYLSSAGNPYLAFNGEAGTTADTFKTRGIKSSIIMSDLLGGMQFGNVPTAAATDNQTFVPLITMLSSGNVGIGTTNPNYKLEVNGTASTTNLYARNATTTYATSTNLYTSGQTILAATAGTAQKVGIGTTNPLAKLDVNAFDGTYDQISAIFHGGENWGGGFNRIQMRSGTGAGVVKTEFTDAIGVAGAGADFRIRVADASDVLQDRFTILAGGNVGIGTTNPDGQLAGTKGLSIVNATNAALGLSNGTNNWLNYLSGTTYRIWNNTSNEVMTILLNGNVGIGTTNPQSKLDILDTNRAPSLTFNAASAFSIHTNATDQLAFGQDTGGVYAFWMQGRNSSNASNALALNPLGGNVGIGTTNPHAQLQVGDYGAFSGFTYPVAANFLSPSDSTNIVSVQRGGTNYPEQLDFGVNQAGLYSTIQSHQSGGSNNALALNPSGGNVGIGTTAPLGDAGDLTLGNVAGTGGELYLYGSTAGAVSTMYTSNGNLHIDSSEGAFPIYLNYYGGTGGVVFGNGSTGTSANVSAAGVYTGTGLTVGAGTITSGLINGQTINATANFTGSLNAVSWADTVLVTNLNADLLDGYTAGNASGNIPISNGTVNTNLNADLLDGAQPSMVAGNSTIVQRNATGYVLANYFNTTADITATAASHFAIQTGSDNYIRWQTPANARTSLGLGAGGAGDIWVERAGDTMTGALTINLGAAASYPLVLTSSSVTTSMGSLNGGYFHNNTTAASGFYYYQNITTAGSFNGAGTGLTGTAASLTAGLASNLTGSPNITTGTITSGLINGQTISSAANFTGSVTVASALTLGSGGSNAWSMQSVFNYTNSDLMFLMAGSEKMRANANGQFCIGYTGASGCTGSAGLLVNGNVGIGTPSPDSKLDVNGAISVYEGLATSGYPIYIKQTSVNQYLSIESTGTFEAMTRYNNPTAGNWYTGIRSTDDTSAFHIYSSIYGNDTFRISTAGAVYIPGTINGQTITSAANFTGTVTVASASGITVGNTSSRIYMNDSDESTGGAKSIHANSNIIGFLSGGSSWLSYWDTAGNQVNTGVVTATQFNGSGAGLTGTASSLTAGLASNLTGSPNITTGTITSGLINGQTISSAANFTGTLTTAGKVTVGGGGISDRKFEVVTNGTNDGLTIGQDVDNSSTIQTYIDGQWTGRVGYASGCCNGLKLQPDVGYVNIGSSWSVDHAGNMTGVGSITSGLINGQTISSAANFTGTANIVGNLTVSSSNTTGGGIILADDGDIVDLNDAYASMRFSSGVRIYSANRGGTPVITLGSNGQVTASQFNGSGAGLTGTAASLTAGSANAVTFNGGLTTGSNPTFAGVYVGAGSYQWANNQYTWTNAPRITSSNSITMYDQYSNYGGAGNPTTYGTMLDIYGRSAHLDSQLYFGEAGQILYRYAFYSQGWNAWQTILTSSNYNSYAPTLTGGGASGNWAINSAGLYGSPNITTGTITSGLINGQTISAAANFTGTIRFATNIGYAGGANTIMDSNQFYCNNASNCHFNYSGTGPTIVGNAAGTGLGGAVTGGTYNGQTITSAANFTGTLTTGGLINATNYLQINGKYAIDGTDSYLRLNQQNSFTSGVYTPYSFRADGTIYVGGTTYYINNGTSYLNALTTAGYIQIGNATSVIGASGTTYGTIGLVTSKNGYYGINFGQATTQPTIMYDASGNGGVYYENTGLWTEFLTRSTNHLNIMTATDLGYSLGVSGTLGVSGVSTLTGNVAIGTTGPLSTLSVGGVGDAAYSIYGSGPSGGIGVYGTSNNIGVMGQTSSTGYGVYGNNTGGGKGVNGSSSSGIGGYFTTTSGSYAVYATAGAAGTGVYGTGGTGVRGVGTSLGVWGEAAATAGYGVYGSNSYTYGTGYAVYGVTAGTATAVRGEAGASGIGGYFTSNSGSALVTGTGNVGIGLTDTSLGKLTVYGGSATTKSIISASGSNIVNLWARNDNWAIGFGMGAASTGYIYRDFNTPTVTMAFDPYGNVGIGCAAPNHILEIGGTGAGCDTGVGSWISAGSTAFTANSSREWKQNIVTFNVSDILTKIQNTPARTYDWKPEYCTATDCTDNLGFIAQEFFGVLGRGDDLHVNGQDIMMAEWLGLQALITENASTTASLALLSQSMQDQGSKIESMQADIDSLMAQASTTLAMVNTDSQRISALENLMASSTMFALNASSSEFTLTASTTLNIISDWFATLGASIVDGVTYFKQLAVESLRAYALTIGEADKPTGITFYDSVNGEPYCLKVTNGVQITSPGECVVGTIVNNSQLSISNLQSSTTDPMIQTNATSTTTDTTASTTPITNDTTASTTLVTIDTTAPTTSTDTSTTTPII